jgi:amino acid adenylation domain-containing protein
MNEFSRRIAALSPEQRALLELRLKQKNIKQPQTSFIPKRTASDALPLSPAQEKLWILHQLDPELPIYNESLLFRLVGQLDIVVLEQSLNEIIKRHEILRTSIVVADGQPIQVIAPTQTITLPIVDLQELPEAEREAKAQQIANRSSSEPFNLAEAPLLRGLLIRLKENEHIMLLTMHHIISDGWSWRVLFRELSTLYQAYLVGNPSTLSELPIQYADFALWQRQRSQEPELETQRRYWKQQLNGASPMLELPTDYPRPAVQTFRGKCEAIVLPQSLSSELKSLSQREGVTLFVLLLAAFNTLLYRYSSTEDILVGTPVANRIRMETEPLIGCFINTLVLRTDLSGNPRFRELLARVRKVTLEAQVHQELPFEQVVRELQPDRALSHNPLFQVLFVFQESTLQALELPDITVKFMLADSGIAKFDLTVLVEDSEQGLTGAIEYNTDLFRADTITRMLEHFRTLLTSIAANPDKRLSELQVLTDAEQHQLLVEWNDTKTDYSQDKCIHQLFEAQVERTPDTVAVVFEDQQLTYRELNQRANQLAHHLQQLGVKPDVLVGICVERSLDMVVGLLGILKAGGAYVPLDPAYPKERLAFMLEDAQVLVLVTQQRLVEMLPPYQAKVICLDKDWDAIAVHHQSNPSSEVTTDNLVYVIYTSGSTGTPKGAMNTHQGLCNRLLWMQDAYQLTARDRVLQKTPFSFDVSVWEFFWPLLCGARLVVAQPGGHQDSAYLVKLIASQQITTIHFVPSMLQIFLEEPGLGVCNCLKRVICSGEALPFSLQERFFACLDAQLHNLYGPTEAAIDVTFWACRRQSDFPIVPIGRPIANTQIYLLDQHLQPVPIGVPGELHIGGDGLARGYLNRPELTDEKFVSNPYNPRGRLYKTGDLARYLPDGTIEYLGRIDHQVKIRGFRIELGEIEACLSQHPEVREAVVVAREDVSGSKGLIAYIVPQEKPGSSVSELRSFLKEKLPDYMVPSAFVMLDSLPLTPNGKVDRRALPAPDRTRVGSEKTFTSPRTPVEEVLAGIWAQVLDIEPVGIHDNFFELGGHSLLATQVIYRVRSTLQVELPLRCLFESPTVAGLAESIEATMKAGQGLKAPPIVPVPRDGNLPLSFAQERLWLMDRLEPNNSAYNVPAALRFIGSLNIAALEQSLNEIVRRHEVLRTTFTVVDGQPIQVIAPSLTLKIPVVDLQALPEAEREAEVLKLAERDVQLPFDLAREPLLRVTLLKLGVSEHVVILTMHHIVSDAWSDAVFIRELTALYEAFSTGKSSPLPELAIQYADFAHWQRQWLQGKVLETLLSYWQHQLAGAPTTLDLKKIASNPPLSTPNEEGTAQYFLLSANVSEKLRILSHQEGTTLFMTLLAAFQTLLYRYTEQNDIVIGTDIANRNRAEIEALIGFFVNLLVLRTDLSGNPSFRELLGRVREVALGAYAHQDLPFAKLVEALQPERRAGRTPLVQVLFVLQNTPTPALKFADLTLTPLQLHTSKAKFDLALFMQETEQGLVAYWQYNTDIFHPVAIARLAHHFETLLSSIVKNPDTRIDALEMLSETEKQKQIAEQAQREKANFKKFKTIKPKAVSLRQKQLIKTSFLQPEQSLPLVIEPDSDEIDLADWAASNREFIENNLLKHGAILFRGFNINSVPEFEKVANAIHPNLFGEYGDLPREGVSGKVYGSTPYPPDKAILFHNESSHLHRWPLKIWFFCVQPAQQGGETPILDCRKVYQLLDPKLRERFEQKQLMYVRNYIEGLDVSWQDFFHTTNKAEVENYCRQAGIDFEWLDNNGLKTRKIRPAIAKHPKTEELVFFNQLQLHHVSCLDPAVRQSLLSVFGENKLPRNVYYGDGTPIEESVMEEIGAIYQKNQVSFAWQQGDILMLENMLTAHSRNPYVGSRKIVVAMGELMTSADL